ncbi:MAG: hypothetical protein K0R45_3069, partial [Pseudomonas sp.]|nr:hypothetical protein [Pseudomonas sp.]
LTLQVESGAGFMSTDKPAWISQMAAQLAGQSAPGGWSDAQMSRWRSERGVSFGLNQSAERLQIDLSTLDSKKGLPAEQRLRSLFEAYRLNQTAAPIQPVALEQSRDELASQLSRSSDNVREQQDQALRRLQFGRDHWPTPSIEQLQALQVEDLQREWQRLSAAPVTYYLLADVEPAVLTPLVEQQLAAIPRGRALHAKASLPSSGQRSETLSIAIEPRAVLHAISFHPRQWTPDDAARIAALKELANAALKQQLRGEAAGIYRLSFDSTLNPDSNRIESRLSFTSDPARVEELWQLAQTTLAKLPASITDKQAAAARSSLARQERLRRDDPQTQLRRLVLSDRRWGDPRYLDSQTNLPQALTAPALKRLAAELFDARNLVQLRLLPAPTQAVARP